MPTDSSSFHLRDLRERIRPFRLHWFPRLRSTNDHAAALRRCGALFAPAAVLTGRQTAGRGRASHTWWSAGGSLTVTFVLAVDDRVEPHQLPLLAGLAVRNAAAELTNETAIDLKWPNDVLYRGRKLAGLLCERVRNVDLVGIGLNINIPLSRAPRDVRGRIASLHEIRGAAVDMTDAVVTVASHLERMLDRAAERSFASILREYDARHALIGRKIRILGGADEPPLAGRCEGLDSIGRLLLRAPDGLHRVISGQVILE